MEFYEIQNEALLERYLLGDVSQQEIDLLEKAFIKYPELKKELIEIEKAFEAYAQVKAIQPGPKTKPLLLAFLDYSERLKAGEPLSSPPMLSPHSKIDDYNEWLNRPDMILPYDFIDFYAKIIGHTKKVTTLIAWLKYGAPNEVHTDEYEKLFIIEGTCNIAFKNIVHTLKEGDFIAIPLHVNHNVEVTSNIPCKVIVELEKITV